jgi:phenylpropionate dioxygenase-like ring-hydroxylating dioxygenase large terminal subunit
MDVQADRSNLDQWHAVGTPELLHDGKIQTILLGERVEIQLDPAGAPEASLRPVQGASRLVAVQIGHGYLWVSLGQPQALFALPELDEPGRRVIRCPAVTVRTSAPRIVENFLDMAHFPFVHPGVLGTRAETEVLPYAVDTDAQAGEILAEECRFEQPQRGAADLAPVPVDYRYRTVGSSVAVLHKKPRARPAGWTVIGLFVQPVQPALCIVHSFVSLTDEQVDDEAVRQGQLAIFLQDLPILQNQQPPELPLGEPRELPVRADRMSSAYRKWLRNAAVTWGTRRHP